MASRRMARTGPRMDARNSGSVSRSMLSERTGLEVGPIGRTRPYRTKRWARKASACPLGCMVSEEIMGFDLIVVGGGLGGSTLAARMASSGRRVLVIESEKQFKGRVHGENMLPWGVAAARRLGIYDKLMAAGAHEPQWWNMYAMGHRMQHRDLLRSTPGGDKTLNIYHPALQEALLRHAEESGAEVRRGARVIGLESGPDRDPRVTFDENGAQRTETARVVVGADGRFSNVRTWGGFEVQRNPEWLTIAGTLVEGSNIPEDGIHLAM